MHVSIYPDTDKLSHEAAQFIARIAKESIASHGRFTIALSGGSTPKTTYALLATEPYQSQIDWSQVQVFWSDERAVTPDNDESNYHMAEEVFLSKVPIPKNQIHRMPADEADREVASEAYTNEMRQIFNFNEVPRFDLIQLGMGPEGHTASLFPHQASLHELNRLVIPVAVPKPPPVRLTFTPPVLNAAKNVLFLVTGSEKADAVKAVIEGEYNPDEYPAQIVRPADGEVTWMLDKEAASKLI